MGKKVNLLVLFAIFTLFVNAQQARYLRLEGTIGSYPIAMHLHQSPDGHYTGFYNYRSTAQPVYVSGQDSLRENRRQLYLFAMLPGDTATERFTLQTSGTDYSGTWESGRKGTAGLKVKLQDVKQELVSAEMIHAKRNEPLFKNKPESPEGSFEMFAVIPRSKVIETKICRVLGDSSTNDIRALTRKEEQQFFSSYHADNQDIADSEWVNHPYTYNNDQSTQVLVAYADTRIMNFAVTYYAYMGGAHGLYATRFVPINLSTGRELTLDDILLPSGKKKLNALLARQVRLQAKLPATEPLTEAGLFEDKIEANDNFFVTSTGIGFNYTPYEIAPYAAGELQYFISFKDLAKDLRPAFRK